MNADQTVIDLALQDALRAVMARLNPADHLAAGAAEAATDRDTLSALSGPLAGFAARYVDGVNGVNELARNTFGLNFVRLNATEQDAILKRLESDVEIAWVLSASGFVELIREHMIAGFPGDPKHDGNHKKVGPRH